MSLKKQIPIVLFFLVLLSILLATLPAAALPPRPTPAPPVGGLIVLTAVTQTPVSPQLWTQVQWQDPQEGSWYEVDGWRGTFDPNLTVTWWVAPSDLNTGPFRWLVYPTENSNGAIGISDPFYLPAAKQTTAVTIALPNE